MLIGDLTMMTLGRVLGQRIMTLPWFRRLLSEPRRVAVEERVRVGMTKQVSYLQ